MKSFIWGAGRHVDQGGEVDSSTRAHKKVRQEPHGDGVFGKSTKLRWGYLANEPGRWSRGGKRDSSNPEGSSKRERGGLLSFFSFLSSDGVDG